MKFQKILTALTIASLASLSHSDLSHADDPKSSGKFAEFYGRYELVSGERHGKAISPERLKGISVRFAENAITTYDKDEKEVYVATYDTDTSKKPWSIVLTATVAPVPGGKGTKAAGLINKSGENVQLIYALPEGKAPTGFQTSENQQMFIMKKVGN